MPWNIAVILKLASDNCSPRLRRYSLHRENSKDCGRCTFAGLVAATSALVQRAQPPVMHLRSLNPYVASALSDWGKPAVNLTPSVPRGDPPIKHPLSAYIITA